MSVEIIVPAASRAGAARAKLREVIVVGGLLGALMLLVYFAYPRSVVVFNDDFGYVRSVVQTIQAKAAHTDDWLEPWAASLSLLSAGIYAVTGQMRLAIYGLQSLLFALLFGLFYFHLRRRRLSVLSALLWAAGAMTLPTMMWKTAEFGAILLCTSCLLVVLYAAERGRWVIFCLAWLVAVSSRQSAICWLVLPWGLLLEKNRMKPVAAAPVRPTIVVTAVCIAAYLLCARTMNPTHARVLMSGFSIHDMFGIRYLENLGLTASVFLIAGGVGRLVLASTLPAFAVRGGDGRRTLIAALAATGGVLFWWFALSSRVGVENPYWGQWPGRSAGAILLLMSVAGWTLVRGEIRRAYILAGLAQALLLSFRPTIWDYYLIELVVLGFFAIKPLPASEEPAQRSRTFGILQAAVALPLVALNLFTARDIKHLLDYHYGVTVLCEKSLDDGTLELSDLSFVSFGLQGWHLYPQLVSDRRFPGAYIAAFSNYLRPGKFRIAVDGTAESPPTCGNGRLARGENVVATTVAPWGWHGHRRFVLIGNSKKSAAPWSLGTDCIPAERYPLDEAEWRALLSAGAR